MRCCPRLPTYVVSILLIVSVALGGVLREDDVRKLAEEKLEESFGERVRLGGISVFLRKPIEFTSIERILLNVREGYPRGNLHIYLRTKRGMRRVSATLELRWRCTLLIASENIQRGERLYPWSVVQEERYMERCPQQGIDFPEELINHVALRAIRKGEPLKKSYLKKEPLIRRGSEVDVIFRKGGLEISFRGEALDTGFYGDTIRVRSLNTGKVLRGRVVSENAVLLR